MLFRASSFGLWIEVEKPAFEFPSFYKKINDGSFMKRHVGDSHFLAVYDGNVRVVHELILRSCWREKFLLIVL
jgi:hypothetical protein